MKYSSLIDNVTSLKWGLSIQQAYLFDWIYSLPSWAESAVIDNKQFYFASKTKAVDDIPLLTDKLDTMYRHYKSLEAKGLIEIVRVDGRDYICLTQKAKEWGRKFTNSENNPRDGSSSELGNKSENVPENNPTYKIIIPDKVIIDTESKDSVPNSLFPEQELPKKKERKKPTKKKVVDPCYDGFVKIWSEEYPILMQGFGAVDGKMIKEIIQKCRVYTKSRGAADTDEAVMGGFKYIIAYVKRERNHCNGQPLTYWNKFLLSIIHEIQNGKQTSKKPSAREFVRNLRKEGY